MWRTRPVLGVSVSASWSPWAAPLGSSERPLKASMRLRAGLPLSALVVWKVWREWSPGFRDVIVSNHTCSPEKGGEGEAATRVSACLLQGSISALRRRHIWCPCARPSFSRKGLSAVVSSPVKTCCPSPAGCGASTRAPRPDPWPACTHTLQWPLLAPTSFSRGSRARPAPGAGPASLSLECKWLTGSLQGRASGGGACA